MRRQSSLIILALALVTLIVAVAGCGTTSADRLAIVQEKIEQGLRVSHELDAAMVQIAQTVEGAKVALQTADGEEATRLLDLIERGQAELRSFADRKSVVVKAVERWEAEVDDAARRANVAWTDELGLIGSGAREVSGLLPSPFNWIVHAAGAIATLVATGFAARERAKSRENQVALEEVVSGVDLVLAKSPTLAETVKATLKAAQTRSTRTLVDELRVST